MSESKRITTPLTSAQRWALGRIGRGQVTRIHELDQRTRRGLEMRGFLVWDRDPKSASFGVIDSAATMRSLRPAAAAARRR